MSYKLLFILNAVVALLLGAALVITPEMALSQFGVETRVAELHMARFFGTALVTLGLVLWFAKDSAEEQIQKNLGMAMLIGIALAIVVTILGVALNGVIRSYGWLVIIIEVVFGLGYAFLMFLQPRMK